MKIIEFFLRNKAFTTSLLLLILLGGAISYIKMGKLEDAPFTIKQALVLTPYPGASPHEVQSQVTDVLEEAIQSLGELYYTKSENRYGLSKITVYVKKEIRADQMQQLWDKLRRKVNDAQRELPASAGTSVVNDDFGDVLGVFYGLTGKGKSYRELEKQAKIIKNELLKIKDVAKVELFGIQTPTIRIDISPSTMVSSGLTSLDIISAFDRQNKVVDAGAIETDDNRIRIETTGTFYSLDEIKNLTIVNQTGEYVRLADIATLSESYAHPSKSKMHINGSPAVGIGISTVPTGNVVDMSNLVAKEIAKFNNEMDKPYHLISLYDQGYESSIANDGFIINLIISVATVVVILFFFIGMKNGLLVGSGLVFSIFATLIVMYIEGIALQRMSLAAIIISMGMLVDNAIVVTDSALINLQKKMPMRDSIQKACASTAIPLLAATGIAILTFLPIYFSPHITGELMSSLVIVIGVSLMFSWVLAVTQTPFCIQQFVKEIPRKGDPVKFYQGKSYIIFRRSLRFILRHKITTLVTMIFLLAISAWGFKFIPKVFVPTLDKQYFTIDVWLPEGTSIDKTERSAQLIAKHVQEYKETEMVSVYVGQSPPRYYLSNISFGPQPNYANLLIKANDSKQARELQEKLNKSIRTSFTESLIKINKFELSPAIEAVIEARFSGPDPAVLDSLTEIALNIMRSNPKTIDVRNEWKNRSMIISPHYDVLKAGRIGISKASMMESTKSICDGTPVGIYRDRENQVPLLLHTTQQTIEGLNSLKDLSIWNGDKSAPLSQLTQEIVIDWEWPKVVTYNRQLSMSAMSGVKPEYTMSEVHNEIREKIESIKLPSGYSFFWDSQFKDQGEAMAALTKFFPVAFLILLLILIALFGNFKDPIIIISILPLSLIGVVSGLLITRFSFGFFPIAGWLGLLGMIIKNVIVLIDEINVQRKQGVSAGIAIIEATVSRTRPVLMAAITTVFGMIPLLFDIAFQGMAASIIFGLTFATLLTLYITPTLYGLLYKIKTH